MTYVNKSIMKRARIVSMVQVVVGPIAALFFCYFFFSSFFFVELSMKVIGALLSAAFIAVSILTFVKGYRLLKIVLVVKKYGAALDIMPKPVSQLSKQFHEDETIVLRRLKGMIDAGYLEGITIDDERQHVISL